MTFLTRSFAVGSVLSLLGVGSAFAGGYNMPCSYGCTMSYNHYQQPCNQCHQTCQTYVQPSVHNADVYNKAMTDVDSHINSYSSNTTGLFQHGGNGYGMWGGYGMPGFDTANVSNNANTDVHSYINAFSTNNTNVDQNGGGFQNASVNNDASTSVNSTINAGSSNNTTLSQM